MAEPAPRNHPEHEPDVPEPSGVPSTPPEDAHVGQPLDGPTPPDAYPPLPAGATIPPLADSYNYPTAPVGAPLQISPPQRGSLLDAWISLITNISRANIAGWSNAARLTANQQWVAVALLVGACLSLAGAILNSTLRLAHLTGQTVVSSLARTNAVLDIFFAPIQYIVVILAFAYALALFMPFTLGDTGNRFRRALTPLALISVPIAAISLVIAILSGITGAVAVNSVTPDFVYMGVAVAAGLLGLLVALAALAFAVYSIAALLQAGTVGSTLSRWMVLGIGILTVIVVSLAIFVVRLPFTFIR